MINSSIHKSLFSPKKERKEKNVWDGTGSGRETVEIQRENKEGVRSWVSAFDWRETRGHSQGSTTRERYREDSVKYGLRVGPHKTSFLWILITPTYI